MPASNPELNPKSQLSRAEYQDALNEGQKVQTTSTRISTNQKNTDPDDPQARPPTQVIGDFNYNVISGVDYYIEIVGYDYERFIQGKENTKPRIIGIRLPLIGAIQSSYRMNYDQSGVQRAYQAAIDATNGELGAAGDALSDTAKQVVKNFLQNGGEFRTALSNQQGSTINENMESSFVSIGIRDHSFSWNLIPRNDTESALILDIIKYSKMLMHPTKAGGQNALLNYPAEFTIGFYRKDGTPLNIPSIPDCFLTSLSVVYNGNGMARFHKNGEAVSYNITMGFMEGQQLTREDIALGNY